MNNASLIFALFNVLFFVTLNNTLALAAGPYIVSDLGGSSDIGFYGVTFYSIGYVLGSPLGRLTIGRIPPGIFFCIFLALFGLTSLGCAMAPNFPVFVLFRFAEGIVSGTFFSTVIKLFSILVPKEKKNFISICLVSTFTILPATSSAVGVLIAYEYNWRWLFYANAPFQVLLGLYFLWKMYKLDISLPILPFDKVAYFFYALAVLPLSLSLTMGQELDWYRSPIITGMTIIGVFALGFYIIWEWNNPAPILNYKLFKNIAFSFAIINLMVFFFVYFGIVILLALWLKLWVSYTPYWIALTIGAMSIAGFFPMVLLSKSMQRFDVRIFLTFAIVLLAISCFNTTSFNLEVDFNRIAYSRVVAGFGLGFFLAPLYRLIFHTFKEENLIAVGSFFQFGRMLAGGLGVASFVTIWIRRQSFYHDRLGEQLTVLSPDTNAYYARASEVGLHGAFANAQLGDLLNRQSIVLALDDCFYLMGWILLGLLVLIGLTFLFKCKGFIPEKQEEMLPAVRYQDLHQKLPAVRDQDLQQDG